MDGRVTRSFGGDVRGRPDRPGLARTLTAAGIRCVVAAPSKLKRPAGDRVKADAARDAEHLARLLRMDYSLRFGCPRAGEEASRDLVRSREDVRGDVMRMRTYSRSGKVQRSASLGYQ